MLKRIGILMLIVLSLLSMCAANDAARAQNSGTPLIQNGDFAQGYTYWSFDQPCTSCWIDVLNGDTPDQNELAWERTNADGNGSALWARQTLDQDVSGYDHLVLDVELRVDYHTLTNSGWWSDQNAGSGEYPLKIGLSFLTSTGDLSGWNWGFMTIHDGSTALRNFTLVPAGTWTALQFDLLAPERWVNATGHPLPQPAILKEIVIGGSGWDFSGAVRSIHITGIHGDLELAGPGFIVEEYPLVSAQTDNPSHFEFKDYLSEDILSVRRHWREPGLGPRVAAANAAIANWGYQLSLNADQKTYTLSHDGTALFADIAYVWQVAVNASGTDFRLLVDSMDGPTRIVMPDTVGKVDSTDFAYIAPVYAGDDLIEISADWGQNQFHVLSNKETIYTVAPGAPSVEPPTKALWSWDGHWIVEVENDLIIDGASLNRQMGYDQSFGFDLIDGKPFYFFTQNGQIAMSYDQQTVEPYRYDDIARYQCCEASAFNISGNPSMVWFYALRDGMWLYVEAGVYR